MEDKAKSTLLTKDFVLLAVVNFLLFSSWQALPFVLPLHMQALGASDATLGLISAVTSVSALLIRPLSGLILDRFGRKGIFLSGIALMGLASASFEFIPIVGILFVLRFVHGLAWGITNTSCQTVAADIIPPKRFGEGMGLFALSGSLALAIVPGLSLYFFSWQGITPVVVLAAGALMLAFICVNFLHYRPIARRSTFNTKDLLEYSSILPSIIIFFLTACYGPLVTFLAIHASAQGVDNIAPFFTAYAVAVALSRPFLGKLVDRKGYAIVLLPGLMFMVGALILLSQANSLLLFVLTAFLYGSGFAACHSALQNMAVANAKPERRGAANATFLIGFDGGIGVGSMASGFIVAAIGYANMYLCFALLPLVSAAIFFAFARKRKPPRLRPEAAQTPLHKN